MNVKLFTRIPCRSLFPLAIAGLLVLSAGCAKKKVEEATHDIPSEEAAFYKAHPGLYREATPADLPSDLTWEDGHDVPVFASPDAKRGGTLHSFTDDFPRTLRFYGPDANGSFRDDIQNTLWLIQKQPNTGQYYPALAREWAFGKDGKTMYFKLDPAARYSDGVPVTADDYVFIFYFFECGYLNDPWSVNFYQEKYANITKYDDLTISVSLREAKPDIGDLVGSLSPVPRHFYKELGPDYPARYQWRLEPTTGPYTVKPEDLHKGVSIDLTRVPDWWADGNRFFQHTCNFERIHVDVIRDPNKAFEAFKRGDLDIFGLALPQQWYEKLADSDPLVQRGCIAKVTAYNQIPRPTYGFYINTAQPLLDNHDIREGIAYASNFDLVDKEYFRGDYERLQTDADDYMEVPLTGIHPRPFSIEQAQASFAKAGFTKRGPDGILVNDKGQRLSFTVTSGYEILRDVLTILRQEAAKAGLELNLEILDGTTAWKKIQEKHHQIAFTAFSSIANGPWATPEEYPRYWEGYASANANKPQTNNLTNTSDPVLDKLIDSYDRATSMDEIRRLALIIEGRLRDEAAFIPGFKRPFYRVGYWRWIRWPAGFGVRLGGANTFLAWYDDSIKPAVLAARDGGPPLPPEIKVYDQWRIKP